MESLMQELAAWEKTQGTLGISADTTKENEKSGTTFIFQAH